jgi:hypothetical protein
MIIVASAVTILLVIAAVAFWVWALIDAIRVPDDSQFRAGNKLLRVIVVVFLHIIGAIIYVAVGRPSRNAMAR